MKHTLALRPSVALTLLLLSTPLYPPSTAFAQGTSFTYQGFLTDQGVPANGVFDFEFRVFDAVTSGAQQGSLVTINDLGLTNGLFTVTLDPGAGVFTGGARWFNVAVRPGVSAGAYVNVVPRQPITATPYAVRALTVASNGLSGGAYSSAVDFNNAANSFSGSFAGAVAGNGAGLSNVNAITIGGLAASNIWSVGGNAGGNPANGAFLGTTDTNALEIKVNGQRALRIEHATNAGFGYSPNMLGGFSGNIISNGLIGAVIGGGGTSTSPNRVGNNFASVIGGAGNTASGSASTAMGNSTMASGSASTAMGLATTASGSPSTAMGASTTASAAYSTAMGTQASALHSGAFVWADFQGLNFASTGVNQFCIRANGGVQLSGDTKMFFGSTLSQKLNLWGTSYGIGIQSGVQYNRTGAGGSFAWYAGGVHNDGTLNAGGGTFLMHLDGNGNLFTAGTVNPPSDRNAKENFTPVDARAVLAKVAALPITGWNYKADSATRHVGPMAQDFHAAFGLGTDERHIATVDADGVALAAIQGLNQKVEEQRAENAELKLELSEIKRLLATLSNKEN